MAFSWKGSVKISGDRSELMAVGQWFVEGIGDWPAQTLAWVLHDGPEPSVIAAWDLISRIGDELTPNDEELDDLVAKGIASGADAEVLQSIEEMRVGKKERPALAAAEIRGWREAVAAAAKQNANNETWTHTADLGGQPLTIQVLSPGEYGRWSSVTLAVFGTDEGGEETTHWARFEPQQVAPCSSWVIVSSAGHVTSLEANEDGARDLDVQQRSLTDEKANAIQWGTGSLVPVADGVKLAGQGIRMVDSKTRVRSFDADILQKGRNKHLLMFQAKAAVSLRPVFLNFLRPIVPILRLVASRKVNRSVASNIDKVMSASDWPTLLALARRSKN